MPEETKNLATKLENIASTVGHRNMNFILEEKGKGPKCFKCNRFGHKRANCPDEWTSKPMLGTHVVGKSGMYIPVRVGNYSVEALVDTGGDLCLLKGSLVQAICPKYFCKTSQLMVSGL